MKLWWEWINNNKWMIINNKELICQALTRKEDKDSIRHHRDLINHKDNPNKVRWVKIFDWIWQLYTIFFINYTFLNYRITYIFFYNNHQY